MDAERCASDVRPLQTGNAALIEIVRRRIDANGPVTFAWFMEQALYDPEHGYYSSGRAAIGRKGDYFTNVSVGPLFGRLMAAQFAEMWRALGEPPEFSIVEQGAHDGQFARDVLAAAAAVHREFSAKLRYVIIEPFHILRERQAQKLTAFEGIVSWRGSISELQPFCGIHFSNELLDAMPVHLVRWDGAEWRERHVTLADDAFRFVDLAVGNPELQARLSRIPLPLPRDYETEVHVAALEWVDAVAEKLTRGFVMTVDYGHPRDQFFAAHRSTGTLRGYADHRIVDSPLHQVGEADITAHVDWTSVAEQAESAGLQLIGFTDQHHFITGLLAGAAGREFEDDANASDRRALQTLLHPQFLGMKFQFLVLAKGLDRIPTLAGLRFANDPRVAVGVRC